MSAQPADQAHQPAALTPNVIVPDAESRLAQLHAQYADAKATADAASERLKQITDGIKAELAALAPEGSTRVDLAGTHGPALRLAYAERVTFDSRKLKTDNPELYVRYAKFGGAWSLRAVSGGDE